MPTCPAHVRNSQRCSILNQPGFVLFCEDEDTVHNPLFLFVQKKSDVSLLSISYERPFWFIAEVYEEGGLVNVKREEETSNLSVIANDNSILNGKSVRMSECGMWNVSRCLFFSTLPV